MSTKKGRPTVFDSGHSCDALIF